jgi:cobalt-zinc-cadmium efflux system membrane fusion protein
MNTKTGGLAALFALAGLVLLSCGSKEKADPAAEAPPATNVVEQPDLNLIKVGKPARFVLVPAEQHEEKPEIHVTGVVNPNIEKSVPVISLASGRVVGIYAKLGDDVQKGQLLLKITSNDIASGLQTYQQAKADQELSRKQLDRSRLLYDHGAISLNDLQVAESTYKKAEVAVTVAARILSTLGADIDRPDPIVNIVAPATGTLVEQNVVATSIIHSPDNQSNLFTIADLSTVWVICNVYENDLPNVRVGDPADVRLNAYPERVFRGKVNNIGKVLDTNIRTAPVRIVLSNPGMMRTGMFVTATLYGVHGRVLAQVPSSAILHLHDRDWVFVPVEGGQFRRTEVVSGKIFEGKQDLLSGLKAGQQVVRDALALSAESEQ